MDIKKMCKLCRKYESLQHKIEAQRTKIDNQISFIMDDDYRYKLSELELTQSQVKHDINQYMIGVDFHWR